LVTKAGGKIMAKKIEESDANYTLNKKRLKNGWRKKKC